MYLENNFEVTEEHSALQLGSGPIKVLATPMMIRFMELTSHQLLDQHLPEGLSSVGFHVDVRHLAPTPINSVVRVRCEIMELKDTRVKFSVAAWDDSDKVGDGTHQRAIIDLKRFQKRVESKIK